MHLNAVALQRLLELHEVLVEVTQRAVLDLRAGDAHRLPVGLLRDDVRALGADRRHGVMEVLALHRICELHRRGLGERG